MIKWFIALFSTLLSFACYTQEKEIFNLQYSYGAHNKLDSVRQVQKIIANVSFPLLQKKQLALFGRIGFRSEYISQIQPSYYPTMYSVPVQLGGLFRLDADKGIFATITFGIQSDMEEITGEDFVMSFMVGYNKRYSERLNLSLGLAYARLFSSHQVVPVAGFSYNNGKKLRLRSRFPIMGRLEYQAGKKHMIGAGWDFIFQNIRLSSGYKESNFVRIKNLTGVCVYEYSLFKGWRLNLNAGYAFVQQYQTFRNGGGNDWYLFAMPLSGRPEPINSFNMRGFVVQSGIAFRLD